MKIAMRSWWFMFMWMCVGLVEQADDLNQIARHSSIAFGKLLCCIMRVSPLLLHHLAFFVFDALFVVAQVMRLERVAFDAVVNALWEGVMLPVVTGDGVEGGGGGGRSSATRSSATVGKRVAQDAAIKRWLEGLRKVQSKLTQLMVVRPLVRGAPPAYGHVGHLRQQALMQLLKRVDALLFQHLVTQGGRAQCVWPCVCFGGQGDACTRPTWSSAHAVHSCACNNNNSAHAHASPAYTPSWRYGE
jgi:hypothetical protein